MLISFVILFVFFIFYLHNYLAAPKFKKNTNLNKKYQYDKLDKNRYSKKKIPNNIDSIIIGSGISGEGNEEILILDQNKLYRYTL